MKPWLKKSLLGLFGASVVLGGLSACGHRHHDGAAWRTRNQRRCQVARTCHRTRRKELQLDDAQKQRLGVLFDKLREQRTALVGNTVNPRAKLGTLIKGDKFDAARAESRWKKRPGPSAPRALK